MVYGEPDENVAVTVDPDVGTAVTVLDVTPSFVKEIVIEVVVLDNAVKLEGADGEFITETIDEIVVVSPLIKAAIS